MKIKYFLRKNILAFLLATIILSLYLYSMIAGNAFCDCAKTEKEKISSSRMHGGHTFFYHK